MHAHEIAKVFQFPEERRLLVVPREDGRIGVLNRFNGTLRGWVMDNKIFADLLVAATRNGAMPGVFPTPFGVIWVLQKDQVRKFHRLARHFEIRDAE